MGRQIEHALGSEPEKMYCHLSTEIFNLSPVAEAERYHQKWKVPEKCWKVQRVCGVGVTQQVQMSVGQ